MGKHSTSFFSRLKRAIFAYFFLVIALWSIYYAAWGRHLYTVTAYCNCPICINVKKYHDGRFASGRKVYWGGAAGDPAISFGSKIELIPHWPQDWAAIFSFLEGKRTYRIEDRGGKIKGKHIDLFVPDSLGGHRTARQWGVRKMRIKLNGEWAG